MASPSLQAVSGVGSAGMICGGRGMVYPLWVLYRYCVLVLVNFPFILFVKFRTILR
jgi:hypothetical protein